MWYIFPPLKQSAPLPGGILPPARLDPGTIASENAESGMPGDPAQTPRPSGAAAGLGSEYWLP